MKRFLRLDRIYMSSCSWIGFVG